MGIEWYSFESLSQKGSRVGDLADMGRSDARGYKTVANVGVWVRLNLNPAIWGAIAGTGWWCSDRCCPGDFD